jgi:hypothetical protein
MTSNETNLTEELRCQLDPIFQKGETIQWRIYSNRSIELVNSINEDTNSHDSFIKDKNNCSNPYFVEGTGVIHDVKELRDKNRLGELIHSSTLIYESLDNASLPAYYYLIATSKDEYIWINEKNIFEIPFIDVEYSDSDSLDEDEDQEPNNSPQACPDHDRIKRIKDKFRHLFKFLPGDKVSWIPDSGDYILARIPVADESVPNKYLNEYVEFPIDSIEGIMGDAIYYYESLGSAQYIKDDKIRAKKEGKFINEYIPVNFTEGLLCRIDIKIGAFEGCIWTPEDFVYPDSSEEIAEDEDIEFFDLICPPPIYLISLTEVDSER